MKGLFGAGGLGGTSVSVALGVLGAILVMSGCQSSKEASQQAQLTESGWSPPAQSEWTALFDGENLNHWTFPSEAAKEVWRVKDGVIDGTPQVYPRGEKHLWTKREFGDFRLHVEWRLKDTKGGKHVMHPIRPNGTYATDANGEPLVIRRRNADSGLYLRGTTDVQTNIWNWPVGSGEVWRYRTNQDLPPEVRAGVTPERRADRPLGEWNTFVITMQGDRLTVTLNGTTVIEEAQLPGVPSEGAIALQHHGGYNRKTDQWSTASSLVQFRNIYIKELSPETATR